MGLYSTQRTARMSAEEEALVGVPRKKNPYKKFSYRGTDLEGLLELSNDKLVQLFNARIRRRFKRDGLGIKHKNLVKKLRKAKAAVTGMEKPETVRTHLRNMPILPEMVGSYLGEYAITYRPISHGRAGLAAGSKFIPLK